MSRIFRRSGGSRFIKSHVIKLRYVNLVCNFKPVPVRSTPSAGLPSSSKQISAGRQRFHKRWAVQLLLHRHFPVTIGRCKVLYVKSQCQLSDSARGRMALVIHLLLQLRAKRNLELLLSIILILSLANNNRWWLSLQ